MPNGQFHGRGGPGIALIFHCRPRAWRPKRCAHLVRRLPEGCLCRPGHSGSAEGPEEGDQDNRNTVARRVHPPCRSRCHTPGPQVLTLVEQDDCDDEQEIDGGTEQRQVEVPIRPTCAASSQVVADGKERAEHDQDVGSQDSRRKRLPLLAPLRRDAEGEVARQDPAHQRLQNSHQHEGPAGEHQERGPPAYGGDLYRP